MLLQGQQNKSGTWSAQFGPFSKQSVSYSENHYCWIISIFILGAFSRCVINSYTPDFLNFWAQEGFLGQFPSHLHSLLSQGTQFHRPLQGPTAGKTVLGWVVFHLSSDRGLSTGPLLIFPSIREDSEACLFKFISDMIERKKMNLLGMISIMPCSLKFSEEGWFIDYAYVCVCLLLDSYTPRTVQELQPHAHPANLGLASHFHVLWVLPFWRTQTSVLPVFWDVCTSASCQIYTHYQHMDNRCLP